MPRSRAHVRLVVPAAPGGAIDAIGRLYAERLKDMLGQTWVVENRAGASNTLGAAEVARAAPDGTTLLTNADIHVMAKHVMKQVPYDPVADFTPISRFATSPMVFVGHPGKTPADLKALAAEMKATPDKHTYLEFRARRHGPSRQRELQQPHRRQDGDRQLPRHGAGPDRRDRRADHADGRPARQRLAADPGRQPARLRGHVGAALAATAGRADHRRGGFPRAELPCSGTRCGARRAWRPTSSPGSTPPCRPPPSIPIWSRS